MKYLFILLWIVSSRFSAYAETCLYIDWHSSLNSNTTGIQVPGPAAFATLNGYKVNFSTQDETIVRKSQYDSNVASSVSRGCLQDFSYNEGNNLLNINLGYVISNGGILLQGSLTAAIYLKSPSGQRIDFCTANLQVVGDRGASCSATKNFVLEQLNPDLANQVRDAVNFARANDSLLKGKYSDLRNKIKLWQDKAARILALEADQLTPNDLSDVPDLLVEFNILRSNVNDIKDQINSIKSNITNSANSMIAQISQEMGELSGEVSIVAPVEIPVVDSLTATETASGLAPPLIEYSGHVQTVLSLLKEAYSAGDRERFLSLLSSWTKQTQAMTLTIQSYKSTSAQDWNSFQRETKVVEAYLYGDEQTPGVIDRNFWFKDSPVPQEVRTLVDDTIEKNYPKEGKKLAKSLKILNQKNYSTSQKTLVETVKVIGQGLKTQPPDGSETLYWSQMLDKASYAGRTLVSESSCFLAGAALGDFSDLYELVSGNDLCSGEELTTSGRLVSAAGLMIGQANAWRRLADTVGISTHVSSAFKLAGSYATKLEAGFVKKVLVLLGKKGFKSETDVRTLFDIVESLKFREIVLIERFLDSAARLGFKEGSKVSEFFKTSAAKTWAKVQSTGNALTDYGYKVFKRDVPVNNPLPQNGIFARVMPRKYVENLRKGQASLTKREFSLTTGEEINEAFITAYEDIADIKGFENVASRLGLFDDEAGTVLRKLSKDDVIIKFKFKENVSSSLRTPYETADNARQFGFVNGGITTGGAKEWLINNDAAKAGIIDLDSIEIVEIIK